LDAEFPSFDSACTCKICNHGFARDCIETNCTCCNKEDSGSHSLVLDGIEGFVPTRTKPSDSKRETTYPHKADTQRRTNLDRQEC
jgi:hypothetical protein